MKKNRDFAQDHEQKESWGTDTVGLGRVRDDCSQNELALLYLENEISLRDLAVESRQFHGRKCYRN